MSYNNFQPQTSLTDELKQLFPHMTPVSEAPRVESEAQFQDEWFKRYSAVKVEGRNRFSYWEVQNPDLLKWQCDRFDKVLFRVKPKMIFPEKPLQKSQQQKQIGYQAKKEIGHEPVFVE
jgi:hypothetical protein